MSVQIAQSPAPCEGSETIVFEGSTRMGSVLISNKRVVIDGVTIPLNQITKVETAEYSSVSDSGVKSTFAILGVGILCLVFFNAKFSKMPPFPLDFLGGIIVLVAGWGIILLLRLVYYYLFKPRDFLCVFAPVRWLNVAVYTNNGKKELLGRRVAYRSLCNDKSDQERFEQTRIQIDSVIEAISKAIGNSSTPPVI